MPAAANKSNNHIPGASVVITLLAALTLFITYQRSQRPILWQPGGAVLGNDQVAPAGWPDGKLDINRATEAELTVLPGIGPALAQRIIEDRDTNGPFANIDDMDRVRGIGMKTIEWFRRYAVVRSDEVVHDQK